MADQRADCSARSSLAPRPSHRWSDPRVEEHLAEQARGWTTPTGSPQQAKDGCHGERATIHQAHRDGTGYQLGALGLLPQRHRALEDAGQQCSRSYAAPCNSSKAPRAARATRVARAAAEK
ncbi:MULTISPECIES: hypothetical protein [Streptomyces]|uniref:Uncharacterized protein n=1 Tax=Streptomyces albidoflavus TaxID=1886 RepID=A0AB37XMX9_9ACTN|nr:MULTISPECIES: hypothetical protein [Streptomyces]RZE45897.1 hypothetical protein C0Q91_02900 [Streptomyces albidoflavus]